MWGPTQNLGQIGLAVLTFIRNNKTGRQTDKQRIYADEILDIFVLILGFSIQEYWR